MKTMDFTCKADCFAVTGWQPEQVSKVLAFFVSSQILFQIFKYHFFLEGEERAGLGEGQRKTRKETPKVKEGEGANCEEPPNRKFKFY
jgi:hypothetical protein